MAHIGRPEAVTPATLDQLVGLRRQGYGYRLIAQKMNVAGVAPPGGGRHWWPGTCRSILLRHEGR